MPIHGCVGNSNRDCGTGQGATTMSTKVQSKTPVATHEAKTASKQTTRRPIKVRRKAKPVDPKIMDLWRRFKKNPTQDMRNELIEIYLHIVKFNAERVHSKLPAEVDVNDLMQAGLFGLMDSIRSFDLSREIKFETFCANRIRGAILDELRSMDWVPRLVRSRTSKIESARKELTAKFGHEPTTQEIAKHLDVGMDELKKIIKDGRTVGVVSLNRKWYETDSSKDVREIDVFKDKRQVNPFRETQKNDLKDLITKGLTRAERLIVILYYYEQMTMKEIGTTLDLSESRVSQMHSSILARLRAHLLHREREFFAAS